MARGAPLVAAARECPDVHNHMGILLGYIYGSYTRATIPCARGERATRGCIDSCLRRDGSYSYLLL